MVLLIFLYKAKAEIMIQKKKMKKNNGIINFLLLDHIKIIYLSLAHTVIQHAYLHTYNFSSSHSLVKSNYLNRFSLLFFLKKFEILLNFSVLFVVLEE